MIKVKNRNLVRYYIEAECWTCGADYKHEIAHDLYETLESGAIDPLCMECESRDLNWNPVVEPQ